ncbi:MAG: hypothetical protein NT027_06330 [Proteobacteria bacterium]|nr:hypothetical protein [Pseudomonadota bacterium]
MIREKSKFCKLEKYWFCALGIAIILQSCKTTQSEPTSAENFAIEGETDLSTSRTAGNNLLLDNTSLPHPKKSSSWETKKLIMTHQQPSDFEISLCKSKLDDLILNSKSYQSLQEASLTFQSTVTESRRLYHWCFYQISAQLDMTLGRDDQSYEAQKEFFANQMKALWILAVDLDNEGTKIYTNHARQRYIEISRSYFGRSIEIIDQSALHVTSGKSGKPAQEFQEP